MDKKFRIDIEEGKAHVYTPYSPEFVSAIKRIGGAKWSGVKKCWTVSAEKVDSVREIMTSVYGENDLEGGEKVDIRITALYDVQSYSGSVILFGRVVCTASGRDSGARPGSEVDIVSGNISSGGSMKNFKAILEKGAVVVMRGVPAALVENYSNEDIQVEIMGRTGAKKPMNYEAMWGALKRELEKEAGTGENAGAGFWLQKMQEMEGKR